MNKCIACVHAVAYPEDLTKRICRGGPPQIVPIQISPSQIQMRNMWPMVNATDDGCGVFNEKIIVDTITGSA